ncbi:tetratricopeptide repeat protein [Marinoscillum sp.]|uniref:tetratricopeptide repeat protein n=1 Tax=Marinoscillum sp. TaxID=2024838 RepID=UPI003BAC8F1B
MKYLLSLLIVFIGLLANAQEKATTQTRKDSIPWELRKNAFIYSMAKQYNDPSVARMALYNLLAETPQNPAIYDTLALWYYEYNQLASAALVAQDAMKLNPDDLFAAEVAAISFEQLGVKNKAVSNYEKLYLANNDIGMLYKIAFLQLDLKRYGEAINNADVIIGSAKSDSEQLVFPIDDKNNTQNVSLKVAAIRLKGMVEEDRGNTSLAKDLYQKALDMQPDFVVLKQQMADLDK